MPKYRVLERSFINNAIVEAGREVDYDGKPGTNLELIEPEVDVDAKPKGKVKAKAETPAGDGADGLV